MIEDIRRMTMSNNWQAKWIWLNELENASNVYLETRGTFHLTHTIDYASIRISANQAYKLYINGIEIGRGPAPADLAWMSYDHYEIAEHLHRGENVIAIIAHNFGQEAIVIEQLQGPGGVICQLDMSGVYPNGEFLASMATGAHWKCRRSPQWVPGASRLHQWGGYREIIDMSKYDGWLLPNYNDTSWEDAQVVADAHQQDSPWPRLIPRSIPPLQETMVSPVKVIAAEGYLGEILNADAVLDTLKSIDSFVTMDASIPGSIPQITYDFGSEVVGYPELEVFSKEGGVIQMFYGESLEMALTDTFILREGKNYLTPFGRRAFRYMKIKIMGTPTALELHKLEVRFVHYPYAKIGSFQSSDERLNRIWEIGKYTTMVNSQNHFEDCPHREGAMWVADAVVMAKVAYQTFGDTALARKCLLQSAQIQNEDGSIPGTGPQRNSFLLPDFCAHWLFGVWDYYLYSDDAVFLEQIWTNMLQLSEWFADQEDLDGLFAHADRESWWCFIDWSDDIERKDKVTAISCYYYKFLVTMSAIAKAIGYKEESSSFRIKAEKLRAIIREKLRVNDTSVLYADCLTSSGLSQSVTAQTNFVAAWTGVMNENEIIQFIKEVYLANKLPPIRGPFFYHIVLETLSRHNLLQEGIEIMREYWGGMLDRGATTWWETFDLSLPLPTFPSPYLGHTPTYLMDSIPVSLSHGWGASPTYILSRELLGVDVTELGQGIVKLRPKKSAGIDWVRGIVPTRLGDIQAEWHVGKDEKLMFKAVLPLGVNWSFEGLVETNITTNKDSVEVSGESI